MIELCSRVAAAARCPAVRPRRGAGSLGQRPAPAPPTRSHGARGARGRPDPVPLAGGLRGLPGRRPARGGGCTAGGRVAVGRERPARPLRLQVPQPADHAHLRLLPAPPGTGTAAPQLLARRGRRVRFATGVLGPPLSPSPRKGKRRVQPVCITPLFAAESRRRYLGAGSAVLWVPRAGGAGGSLVSRDFGARRWAGLVHPPRPGQGARHRSCVPQCALARGGVAAAGGAPIPSPTLPGLARGRRGEEGKRRGGYGTLPRGRVWMRLQASWGPYLPSPRSLRVGTVVCRRFGGEARLWRGSAVARTPAGPAWEPRVQGAWGAARSCLPAGVRARAL